MKKVLLLALLLTGISLLISWSRPSFFETVEKKLYDVHFALRGPVPISGKVVLITIDEKSINKLGRWPWPRSTFSRIFEELVAEGARIVAPDIFFADPSRGPIGEQNDAMLAKTLRENSNIFTGYYFLMTHEEIEESNLSPERLEENLRNVRGSALEVPFRPPGLKEAIGIQDTLPIFSNLPGGKRQGFFNMIGDPDGTVREVPVLIGYQGAVFPSLQLQVALSVIGDDEDPLPLLKRLRLNREGRFLVNFRGDTRLFPRVSAADLLEEDQSFLVADRIVLVGATAAGLEDFRPTPIGPTIASVVLTANIIDNMIQGDLLRKDSLTDLLSRLLILATGLILAFGLSRVKALPGFLLFLSLLLAEALLLHFLFLKWRCVLQNIYPFFSCFFVYGGTTIYRYLVEEKEKRFISETFQHYLSPDVIRELTAHPEKVRLGGERKELTVFFSDIRDFTTIVEETKAETLVAFLNSYLTPVTDVILSQKGLLDKYIGDAVMAVFGAPLPEPDHPELACQAAVEMIRLVKKERERWATEFKVLKLRIGIGINTGPMTVGNMGSERRFDYTVVGDAVNLASRLEGLNKFYGTQILVSQSTFEPVKNLFPFRELDEARVKGKKQAVRIYELMADLQTAQEKILPLFREALERYKGGQFGPAMELFQKCLILDPKDGPSTLFLSRCQEYMKRPPEDWEGVTQFKEK